MKKAYLKWKFKRLYLKTKYGFEDYNCGHKVLLGISSRYYDCCKRFNETAERLSKIDEGCPKFRYDLT
jgi:hypothetical protein